MVFGNCKSYTTTIEKKSFMDSEASAATALRGIAFAHHDAGVLAAESIHLPRCAPDSTQGARVPRDQRRGDFLAAL